MNLRHLRTFIAIVDAGGASLSAKSFERYGCHCHCRSAEEARALWRAIADRRGTYKLVLHPQKAKMQHKPSTRAQLRRCGAGLKIQSKPAHRSTPVSGGDHPKVASAMFEMGG